MSDQANMLPSTVPSSSTSSPGNATGAEPTTRAVVVTEPETDSVSSESESDPNRRRRRRRRRRSVRNEVFERRIRLLLIATVALLITVVATGGKIRKLVGNINASLHSAHPNPVLSTIKGLFSLEMLALLIAVLILLYLMPGVEEKVMRALGIKRDRHRR